jgi:predicted transcriptional regulator
MTTKKKTKEAAEDRTAISIWVDQELRRAIEERAKRDDRSASYIARKAIEQYLEIQKVAEA